MGEVLELDSFEYMEYVCACGNETFRIEVDPRGNVYPVCSGCDGKILRFTMEDTWTDG